MTTQSVSRISLPVHQSGSIVSYGKEDLDRLNQALSLFDQNQKSKKIPSSWYTDPQIYKAEMHEIFGRNWVGVGHLEQLPTPLTFFQEKIDKKPLLVLKDKDANLRAFANVCRHSLYPVAKGASGVLEKDENGNGILECKNHGWCYEPSEGKVCYIPEPGKMPGIKKEDLSLIPFEVDKWGPLVFVRMGKDDDSPSLSSVLAPLIEQTANRDLSAFKWRKRVEYTLPCNWKVFVDNYDDGGYHVPVAHPALAKGLDYDNYRTEIFEYTSLQHTLTKDANDSTSAARNGAGAMYWWLFPNVMVNLYNNTMDTNIVIPLGVDKCKVIFDFYSTDEVPIETYADGAHVVQLEDEDLCLGMQGGLESGICDPGPNMKRETGIRHFHELVAKNLMRFRDRVEKQ